MFADAEFTCLGCGAVLLVRLGTTPEFVTPWRSNQHRHGARVEHDCTGGGSWSRSSLEFLDARVEA